MKHRKPFLIALLFGLVWIPLSHAQGPDEKTQALIDKLRLEEADEPIRNSPIWRKPEKVHIALPTSDPEQQEKLLAQARQVAGETCPVNPAIWTTSGSKDY